MGMKKKFLALSLLTVVCCLSLLVGATLALFASKREVDISVTSGNVEVKATISDYSTYSKGVEMTKGTFENGGTATVEGNSVVLDRISPMDRVILEIAVENKSDIAYKYRMKLGSEIKNTLYDQMLVGLSENREEFEYYNSYVTAWQDGTELDTATLYLSIELPEYVKSDWQNKECKFTLTFEAVQGNAAVTDDEAVSRVYIVESQEELNETLDKMVSGDTVVLGGGEWVHATIALDDTDKAVNVRGYDVGSMEVNAPNGSVNLYSDQESLYVISSRSTRIFGAVQNVDISEGQIVVEAGANVETIATNPEEGKVVNIEVSEEALVKEVIASGEGETFVEGNVGNFEGDVTISYVLEATSDAAANGIALREILNTITDKAKVELTAGEYQLDEAIVLPSGVSLYGAQSGVPAVEWATDESAEKTVIYAPEGSDRCIKIEQGDGETVSDVVIDGIMVDGGEKNLKGIFVKKTAGEAMTGIVIRNNAVVNCENDGIDVNNTNGAVIENNYIEGVYDNGIQLSSYDNAEGVTAYVCNNVLKNVGGTANGGTVNGAIAISGGQGDVVVSGNVLETIRSDGQVELPLVDMGESAIVVESVYEGGVITIENNALTDVEQGIAVYKFSAPSDADKVVIRSNSIEGAQKFAIATSTLNYKGFASTALVEVSENTIIGDMSAEKGDIYIETVNRYNEKTTGWKVVVDGAFVDDTMTPINNASDLFAFAESANGGTSYEGKTVILLNDIDLQNKEWTPIGNNSTEAENFSGVFDGNGKTVSNLKITAVNVTQWQDWGYKNSYNYAGLFGVVAGTVKNLTAENVTITVSDLNLEQRGDVYAGTIAGANFGTIENVTVKKSVVDATAWLICSAGGVVGSNVGGISSCIADDVTVSATSEGWTSNAGGVTGASGDRLYWNISASVKNSVAKNCKISSNVLGSVSTSEIDYPSETTYFGRVYCGGIGGLGVNTTTQSNMVENNELTTESYASGDYIIFQNDNWGYGA